MLSRRWWRSRRQCPGGHAHPWSFQAARVYLSLTSVVCHPEGSRAGVGQPPFSGMSGTPTPGRGRRCPPPPRASAPRVGHSTRRGHVSACEACVEIPSPRCPGESCAGEECGPVRSAGGSLQVPSRPSRRDVPRPCPEPVSSFPAGAGALAAGPPTPLCRGAPSAFVFWKCV